MSLWQSLRLNQIIETEVLENQAAGGLLVGWQGRLLLVKNLSRQNFIKGERVRLQVESISPLSFVIAKDKSTRQRLKWSIES